MFSDHLFDSGVLQTSMDLVRRHMLVAMLEEEDRVSPGVARGCGWWRHRGREMVPASGHTRALLHAPARARRPGVWRGGQCAQLVRCRRQPAALAHSPHLALSLGDDITREGICYRETHEELM